MRQKLRRATFGILGAAILYFGSAAANGQTAPPKKPATPAAKSAPATKPAAATSDKPIMAEQYFKDVQILKGIPVDVFMDTMGYMAASLSFNCSDCHDLENFAAPQKNKTTARKMLAMVNSINKNNFGGERVVSCYTCHRDAPDPKITPSLLVQYETPTQDPNEVEVPAKSEGGPTADQVFDKYMQALGGAQKVSAITSLVAKGNYTGYDTTNLPRPIDIYTKPNERSAIVHDKLGDISWISDGRNAWHVEPANIVTLTTYTGAELDGAKLDANVLFPAQLKSSFAQWRVGYTTIDDKDVMVLQGMNPGKSPVKLFFDKASGLLVRTVRYSQTPIGIVPSQVDYSDYRPVNGVQVPFKWLLTWTDGQSTIELNNVQANVTIDAAKFNKPAEPPRQQ